MCLCVCVSVCLCVFVLVYNITLPIPYTHTGTVHPAVVLIHVGSGTVNAENVFKVCDQPHPLLVKQMLEACLVGDIETAHEGTISCRFFFWFSSQFSCIQGFIYCIFIHHSYYFVCLYIYVCVEKWRKAQCVLFFIARARTEH